MEELKERYGEKVKSSADIAEIVGSRPRKKP